jgi:hypothetical protein
MMSDKELLDRIRWRNDKFIFGLTHYTCAVISMLKGSMSIWWHYQTGILRHD